jgi:hypothetical protein
MTLDNLLRIGKLKPHIADKAEIERLLAAAERALQDAGLQGLSTDSRLDLAYRAIMQAALIAMLVNNFRPATSEPGHHQLLIQALPKTIGLPADRVPVLEGFRATRNMSDYRGVSVSDTVTLECIGEAHRLLKEVRAWLMAYRPDLA